MNKTKEYTVGQIIRFYREREGLTQEELAEIIHVTKGKLAHWEDDVTIPRPTMVARLIGALRISDAEAPLLMNAVQAAEETKAQEQAALQAIADEQNAESERLQHKSKAIKLSLIGLLGFAAGFIFVFITGSHSDFPWYAPIVIGLCVAGIPFGWSILTDKSEREAGYSYYPDPDIQRTNLLIMLAFYLLKFIGAYLIGLVAFPIVLLYHAYKAGRKGSLYKKMMCIVLIFIALFIGIIVFCIAAASFSK